MKLATLALTLLLPFTACASTAPDDLGAEPDEGGTTTTGTTGAGGTGMTTQCAVGQTLCSAGCTDTLLDPVNCGACGNACMPGTTCSAGACVCAAPLVDCGGLCVNTNEDVLHCGMCSMASGATQGCAAGACSCPAGYTGCAEACLDVQSDINNCGGSRSTGSPLS
jgi:hypothetical protein